MVIQRDKDLRVWGWAEKSEEVTVEFDGQAKKAIAGDDGLWSVVFGPFKANSTPQVMTIKGAGNTIALKNVLIGDVWLLGGQSNMEHELVSIYEADMEVPSAHYPEIRYMSIPQLQYDSPRDDIERFHQFSGWDRSIKKRAMWEVCSPQTVRHFCGIGYLFGRRLHVISRVPIGLVDVSRGGTTVETWTSMDSLKKIPEAEGMMAEADQKRIQREKNFNAEADLQERIRVWGIESGERAKLDLQPIPKPTGLRSGPDADKHDPSACYNATIAPLRGMVLKGIIFNQGHNNADENCRPALYAKAIKAMIGDWRNVFGAEDLPFGIIAFVSGGSPQTLDNFEAMGIADAAPFIREAQFAAFKELQNVGFTASYDQQMTFYHTYNKRPLAERMARWALNTQYGVGTGWRPAQLVSHEKQGNTIVLKFDRAVQQTGQNGRPIEGMAIAGMDRHFYPASARFAVIKDKDNRDVTDHTRVVVWNDLIPDPQAVRYAWARNPLGNLCNSAHMERLIPVPTFRTDNWPIAFGPEYDSGKAEGIAKEAKGDLQVLKKLAAELARKRKRQEAVMLYQQTAEPEPKATAVFGGVKIDPSVINVVSASLGMLDANLESHFQNHMNLWVQIKKPGPCAIEWTIQAPLDGLYDASAVVLAKGSHVTLSCNGQKLEATLEGHGWERLGLGQIRLSAGENRLQLAVEAVKGFQLDSLELTQPSVKAAMLKEALVMREQPDWFKDAGYGLMFQWTNRSTPPMGSIKPWGEKVNDFNVQTFADMVQETGAAYVIWSITWGQQYISAPIQSLDRIIPGRTTKKDLLGEMANALHARGIKLIFYYHYGYDCYHCVDADWMKASGGYAADKTKLYQNLMAIVTEVGNRYGDKLHGWWFDGGQRYYDCHFDNSSPAIGILTAPFKQITQAARSGNAGRIVAYNSWIKPRLTEYQDYYGGEGQRGFVGTSLKEGVFVAGGQAGLQGHGCFPFENYWAHIVLNTPIPKPRYELKQLTGLIRDAQKYRYPLSLNLEMYEDGSVSSESVVLLKQLREVIRGK